MIYVKKVTPLIDILKKKPTLIPNLWTAISKNKWEDAGKLMVKEFKDKEYAKSLIAKLPLSAAIKAKAQKMMDIVYIVGAHYDTCKSILLQLIDMAKSMRRRDRRLYAKTGRRLMTNETKGKILSIAVKMIDILGDRQKVNMIMKFFHVPATTQSKINPYIDRILKIKNLIFRKDKKALPDALH
jgi:hypothetical protein